MKQISTIVIGSAIALSAALIPDTAQASSHREAPAIAEDQFADNTDVYTFISPNNPDNLVIVANYVPLLIPHSGPNFYRFSDRVRYEILIDNDGDAKPDVKYHFKFNTTTANGGTFLHNVGPIEDINSANLNIKQTYDLFKVTNEDGFQVEQVVEGAPVAPWHVGDRSFPDGSYEGVAMQAITDSADGGQVFAGPRDEPFFVDLHVFDLLGVGGFPSTDGVNVMSLVMEVPIAELSKGGERPTEASDPTQQVLGVYARAKRPIVTVRPPAGGDIEFGGFQQVSRLAWPLVNEVIIPLGDKDKYNKSRPHNDVANFGGYILDPEIPGLLNAVLGLDCPPTPDEGRLDIVGLLAPNGTTAADLLRINVLPGQTFEDSGFPNGRTLSDDVTDTLLTVACDNGAVIGDGVDANDLAFSSQMPYLAPPHSGNPL